MILLPQYRTSRRAAAATITVLEEISQGNATGTLPNLVFAGTPSNGEKLVALVCCGGAAPTTVPSGFSLIASHTATSDRAYLYEKTASSESGTYTWAAGTRCAVMMARLSQGALETSGTNSTASASSLIMPATGLAVPSNSYCVASWHTSTANNVSSVGNSFSIVIAASSFRSCIATRLYTTGGASEQVNGSAVSASAIGGILAVFKP